MFRCVVFGLAAAVIAQGAAAQVARHFPANALRGEVVVGQPPLITLNGRTAQLAPGARIRGEDNLIKVSGGLVGQQLVVNYTVDQYGLVADVWVLTAAERARQPWPVTAAQAATWTFDPVAQTWTAP